MPRFLYTAPITATVGFLLSYRLVGLSIVESIERKRGVEFKKPSTLPGILYSAVLPFLLAGAAVLFFVVSQRISPMHDSM
jgi:hypothetical protein